MIGRRAFATLFGVLVPLVVGAGQLSANHSGPPHLVVIMTDDLSVDALDAVVAAGRMPNLKTMLIDQGVSFANAFVTDPLCCPSRATFLRGQYAHNHRVYSNTTGEPGRPGIAWPGWFPENGSPGKNESTIATWLRDAGYHTGHIGKYLNGYGMVAPQGTADPQTYIPPGWDDWQGLIDPTTYQVYDYTMNDNGTIVTFGSAETDYQTDVLTNRAAAFVEARAQAVEPFFLMVTPLAPHVEVLDSLTLLSSTEVRDSFALEIRAAPRHLHLVDGDPLNGEVPSPVMKPSFDEADLTDKPGGCPVPEPIPELTYNTDPNCIAERPALRADIDIPAIERQYKTMLASMLAVDDLIGAVTSALEANGILNETVIVFTSDNGWFYGEHRLHGKNMAYEESIRVPLIVRGPGFAANATAQQVVLNNDLAPTLAALGGATPGYDPDGRSIVPLLQDPGRSDWGRTTFLVEHWFIPGLGKFDLATYSALRINSATLDALYVATRADRQVPGEITHREFYNLATDPYQMSSMTLQPTVTSELDGLLGRLRSCAGQNCRTLETKF